MVARSWRGGWYSRVGSLALLATALLTSEAQASFAVLTVDNAVTGGSFVNHQQFATAAQDRLSFTVYGDYSFTANATSATVSLTTNLTLPFNPQGPYNVSTSIDGFFASSMPLTTARITDYSASSFLFNFVGFPSVVVPVPGTTAAASIATLPESLPTVTSGFPLSSLHLQDSATTPTTIPSGTFVEFLGQVSTINFDMLAVGETISIELPDDSSLTPTVPEPQSITLLGLGSLITLGATMLRKLMSRSASVRREPEDE